MKTLFLLGCLAAASLALMGCAADRGDPNANGIFWSESQAQDRLNERQDRLNDINADTANERQRNQQLENQTNQ